MLAIARALVTKPRLLLLDEISMGLAPLVVAELYEVVRALASEDITVVLAEQFAQSALSVADHGGHRGAGSHRQWAIPRDRRRGDRLVHGI